MSDSEIAEVNAYKDPDIGGIKVWAMYCRTFSVFIPREQEFRDNVVLFP